MQIAIRWAYPEDNSQDLVGFFVANVAPEYISHGEIQDGRADAVGRWSARLGEILGEQFALACNGQSDGSCGQTRLALATASDGLLAAIAYLGLDVTAAHPYAVLYDLVVAARRRGEGVGSRLLAWLEEQLRTEGIEYLFLESGIGNARAHHFFEAKGFTPVSLNFMKNL